MTFLLSVPPSRLSPLRWVSDIVYGKMLGVPVDVISGSRAEVVLSAEGRSLVMPSIFPELGVDRLRWLTQFPQLPLGEWDVAVDFPGADFEAPLPVLLGDATIALGDDRIRCGVDILGTIFFFLSRFEEAVLPDRDRHDRFPATASLAWKAGFLYRPIVDEHVEALRTMMAWLWPSLEIKRRKGTVRISCDVDQPFDRMGRNPISLLRVLRHELFLKPRPPIAALRAANFFASLFGIHRFDPYYTFDWYMDVCERHGRRAAFYFIADHSAGAIDGTYQIGEPRIVALIRQLATRGHEIGMHGSYDSYLDGARVRKERARLEDACNKAGLEAPVRGNRQHYLRWSTTETPDHLDEAGFDYDTSGSFADRPGFRYGTAHPFPMWSWKRQAPLRLMQRPLVAMECSILADGYLGLGHTEEALALFLKLKARAMRHGGDFTLLWHNSELLSEKDRELFEILVK
jgi:hypothetical protein